MTDHQTQFNVRVDPELKRLVTADPRSNKDVTKTALWRELGGQRQAAIDVRIEHKEKREKMIKSEIEDLEEELADIRADKQALLTRREDMMSSDEAYQQDLEDLLARLEEDDLKRLTPELRDVEEVAEGTEHSAQEVWEDARELAAKQERAIQNVEFMTPTEAQKLTYHDVELIADAYGGDDE